MRVAMKIYYLSKSREFVISFKKYQNTGKSSNFFNRAEPQFSGSKDRVVKSRSKIEQNN